MKAKQTLHEQISGMTCVNCTKAVERVTKRLDGLEDAKESSVSNDGTFVYEDKKISQEQNTIYYFIFDYLTIFVPWLICSYEISLFLMNL